MKFIIITLLCWTTLTEPIRVAKRPQSQNAKDRVFGARVSEKECNKYAARVHTRLYPYFKSKLYAVDGEFPHVCAIYVHGGVTNIASGNIISPRYILTTSLIAGHSYRRDEMFVRVGTSAHSHDFTAGRTYEIEEHIVHPNYTTFTFYNDISIMKTSVTIEFSYFVQPACLHTDPEVPDLIFESPGWGDHNGNYLMKATASVISKQSCEKYYTNNTRRLPLGLTESHICAVDKNELTTHCSGDAGSPLQYINSDNRLYSIFGLTSFGRGCNPQTPEVFTNVTNFLDWIEMVVWL